MAQYLTRDEYMGMGGEAMDAQAYDRHVLRAWKAVDRHCFGRVCGGAAEREAVKALMYELVGLYAANEARRADGGVKGWENDGVRVSLERAAPMTDRALEAEAKSLVYAWLARGTDAGGTPLLYRGRVSGW